MILSEEEEKKINELDNIDVSDLDDTDCEIDLS